MIAVTPQALTTAAKEFLQVAPDVRQTVRIINLAARINGTGEVFDEDLLIAQAAELQLSLPADTLDAIETELSRQIVGIGVGVGGVADGNKGDIQVSAGGTAWLITALTKAGFPVSTAQAAADAVVLAAAAVDATTKANAVYTAAIAAAATDATVKAAAALASAVAADATNANLTGPITSVGNATTITPGVVTEAMQVLADNATQDVSIAKHGYAPKAPNDAAKFLDGTGAYSVPAGGGGGGPPTGAAGGALTGTYPNPGLAAHAASHATGGSDPVTVTKAQVGLGNADNTADSAKPVSTAQATADALVASNAASALATHAGLTTSAHGGIVASSDSRLTDARTPTAHAASHASGGSDPITLAQSQVTNLASDLALKAPLASPALSGVPTAPTAAGGTNTTQIASTAFVTAAVGAVGPAAAGTLTGATLAANVLASSLTSVGTLATLTVTAAIAGSVTGNAGTATILATGRTINGTTFDGSSNITVTAAAGTLTGTVLNSAVVTSSLTSVGTLLNLTVTNPITGSITGNAATVTTIPNLTGNVTSSGNVTTIAAGVVTEAMQVLANNTTNDVSTTKHGYAPILPNDATKYLDGTGAYSVPAGGGGIDLLTVWAFS